MKLMNEEQVLDAEFRKQVIAEILGAENEARKAEHLKRREVYKDMTLKWVMKSLQAEGLKPETLKQMESRASNISICRKIVNKLARTYSHGVSRTTGDTEADKAVSEMSRYLGFDNKMRKSDRYRELHRNCAVYFCQDRTGGTDEMPTYKIAMRILAPWQYDVIEDCYDRETARCFILSDYWEGDGGTAAATEQDAGVHSSGMADAKFRNQKDDVIADAPLDAGKGKKRTFIWWTQNYHFTTYEDASYCDEMTPEDRDNPIGMLPFVVNAEDQDGQFWADGGDDIISGSILVNKVITDMFYIMYFQGYGIPVITGKNLNERFEIGPQGALIFNYDPGQEEPEPKVYFAQASASFDAWMKAVEQYVALLLTTNNLSPSQVAGKLDAANFPSAIAMLVESSEATKDTEDKQTVYAEQERKEWTIIQAWQAVLNQTDEVDLEFFELPALPEDIGDSLTVKFMDLKVATTEAEKLANLKARKELGLNTMIELLKSDNPDLTDEEAEKKALALTEEKLQRASTFGTPDVNATGANAADQNANDQVPPADNQSPDDNAGAA